MPFAISKANLLRISHYNGTFLFYNKLHNDLLEQYSKIIAKFGNFVHTPRQVTILGCLRDSIALDSSF